MPGGTASAKALKQECTSYGEYRGTRSQRRDGNGGQLTRALQQPTWSFTWCGVSSLGKDLGRGVTSSDLF